MKWKEAILIALLAAAITPTLQMLPLESCSRSEYILAGNSLKAVSDEVECNLTSSDGIEYIDGGQSMILSRPGPYTYKCLNSSGNITVVNAQHKIVLCPNCTHHNLIIQENEMIHWTVLRELPCTQVLLVNVESGAVISSFSNTTATNKHLFDQSGSFQLTCNRGLLANISVLSGYQLTNEQGNYYKELVYTHAALMAISFAVLIPFGAILAHFKLPVAHMIIQPLALALSCIALILAVVYKEMNHETHFNQPHSIVGLILLVVAIIVLPGLKLSVVAPITEKWRKIVSIWHKRLGTIAVFFGIFNIVLGLLLISAPLYIAIVYGIWIAVCVIVFVLSGVFKKKSSESLDDEESVLVSCCHYRSDKMTLTRKNSDGPMKLSKDFLSEGKYVMARKKSVDVLEMANRGEISQNNVPQRKISNVHFGPIAVAANLTPLGPQTPEVAVTPTTQFGFNNRYSSNDSESSEEEETSKSRSDDDLDGAEGKNDTGIEFMAHEIRGSNDSLRITRHSGRAHTKLKDVFERSNSFGQQQHQPSPLILSLDKEKSNEEEEKQIKEVSPDTSPDEEFPKQCPFHRSQFSHSSLPAHFSHSSLSSRSEVPLQQRRMRKNAFTPNQEAPPIEQLELPRNAPRRSISRNSSFRRKQQTMLVDNTLKSVMSISDDAIICANASGEIVFWSSGAVKMFGYTPKEAIGSSLQMIMPQKYKEKHQNGINKRTDRAIEYIKKHHTAPEEQKHARLYSVLGLSKAGKEFEVEVVVTSFVIEGDIFYTGIISEVKGLTRQQSASSLSSEIEIKERQQKAMAIGAQMKVAHKLKSAEQISKRELTNIMTTSLKSAQVQVVQEDITLMVDAIMKAGDADESEVIKFVDLIDLLAKNRLYISDSGLIAKYGKTKATDVSRPSQKCCSRLSFFLLSNLSTLAWVSVYFLLSVVLVLVGVFTTEKGGWGKWAYGTGPVLSFNCVVVVLPLLRSLIHAMKGSSWLNKVLPLNKWLSFHLLIVAGIFAWTIVHIGTHLCSFALDDKNENTTYGEHLKENAITHLMPIITGGLSILILLVLTLSSIKPLRSLCFFVGFYSVHWIGFTLFYILLIIHGTNYYNPSFWKWLLPVLVIYVFERIHNRWIVDRYTIKLLHAAPYDELSRTTKVEITKPKQYKFIPGQYLLLNIPQIGYFNWQQCRISSTNKEKTLTLYLPHSGSAWLEKAFKTFKANPVKSKNPEEMTLARQIDLLVTKPFGVGADCIFDYKAAVLLCGEEGPSTCRSIIQKFLEYRRSSCHCGCHPSLSKLYFVWVTPSGNDNEWFTDFLSELTEDQHLAKYFDIRVFLTNIDSPPDELASALLHLALKTGGPALSVRRPSQPQLSKLHTNTSYGVPDFEALLDFVSMQQGTSTAQEAECGVFVAGELPTHIYKDLIHFCNVCSNKKHLDTLENTITSPLRRTSSQVNSPERNAPPQEWHITFKPQTLIL